ncbi:MAG: hypothetical protein M3Y71_18020 [Actinomycetota bacterium]|nr:hypothetical protein [Actinomycetota bacterium]
MKLYSDLPGRRAAQVTSDASTLVWVTVWVVVGRRVHDDVQQLQGTADQLTGAGTSFGGNMSGAAEQLAKVPLLGEQVRRPFDGAAGSAEQLAQAGRDMHSTVGRMALVLGVTAALVPILLVVGTWLALRVRFVRRANAAQRFVDTDADLDLFALRAMARQPMHKLAAVCDDPAGAWRTGDVEVVRRLALLELRSSGLRPPRPRTEPG